MFNYRCNSNIGTIEKYFREKLKNFWHTNCFMTQGRAIKQYSCQLFLARYLHCDKYLKFLANCVDRLYVADFITSASFSYVTGSMLVYAVGNP